MNVCNFVCIFAYAFSAHAYRNLVNTIQREKYFYYTLPYHNGNIMLSYLMPHIEYVKQV